MSDGGDKGSSGSLASKGKLEEKPKEADLGM